MTFEEWFDKDDANYVEDLARDLGRQGAQILLHSFGRGAGGSGGTVQARPDPAAHAQRGGIDMDRLGHQRQTAILPGYRQLQVEPCAEGQGIERAGKIGRCPPPQGNVDPRAGGNVRQRHGACHHRGHLLRLC